MWERGRGEGPPPIALTVSLPLPRPASRLTYRGRALTPAPLPSGRGVPRALWRRLRANASGDCRENLSPPFAAALILAGPHPRGAAIRRCANGGRRFGACGWSHDPLPGGFGNRPGGKTAPARGARWTARRLQPAPRPDDAERPASEPSDAGQRIGGDPRRTASEGSRHRPAIGPISAARSQKSPEAERHGACGRWLNPSAPHPGSTDAALYPIAPRGAPLAPHGERSRTSAGGRRRALSLLPLREKVARRSRDG